jgi:dual-specificity kinase
MSRRDGKEEPGVFAGFIGDGVDKSKEFPSGRYTITKKLGSGTYGKVLGCVDKKYNLPVAIKIVRKDPPIYKESAKKEIAVLRHLGGTHGCLRLLRDFEHDGHLCISAEMYGENLQSYMKRSKGPFALSAVANIGVQLMHACEYMHGKNIIHTDIKSENILLAAGPEGAYTIKLVDMGSAIFTSWWHPPIIGTMEYRAPEALLQAGWSCPVDNFACGCVLAELYTGEYLLPGLREEEHLRAIEVALEMRLPQELMRLGKKNTNQYNQKLIIKRGSEFTLPDVHLQYPITKLRTIIKDPEFYQLVRGLLQMDPTARFSASDAKNHVFFKRSTFDLHNLDAAFCLRPRGSEPPAYNPEQYNFCEADIVEDETDDIIESTMSFDLPVPDVPPSRAPPPAPKPLKDVVKSENFKAQKATPVRTSRGREEQQEQHQQEQLQQAQQEQKIEAESHPTVRNSINLLEGPPKAKLPLLPNAPSSESVQAAKVLTPIQPPQLLAKSESARKQERSDYPTQAYVQNESPQIKKPTRSSSQNSQSKEATRSGFVADQADTATPKPQETKKGKGILNSVASAVKQTLNKSATNSPNLTTLAETPGPVPVSPISQNYQSAAQMLSNLTSAVKTSISSPLTTPNFSYLSPLVVPPTMEPVPKMDENVSLNSTREVNGISDETGRKNDYKRVNGSNPDSNPETHSPVVTADGNVSDGIPPADLSWECDLSDRLSRLHERLTRLRHENAIWAEGVEARNRQRSS